MKGIDMVRRLSVLAGVVALASVLMVPAASAGKARTYEVTITNLTTGQPLTPPVVAAHKKPVEIFEVGNAASYAVQQLAENGNGGPLVAELGANKHVSAIWEATEPLVPAGTPGAEDLGFKDYVTFEITSYKGAKYLSVASMLICTNDGFTGVDGVRLPKKVGQSKTIWSDAYDAGTENNTEDFADMVPPCQGLIGVVAMPAETGTGTTNGALAEGGVIHHHNGIVGGIDDLTVSDHGFTNPVIEITIERIS
jgi:hypothetical protein